MLKFPDVIGQDPWIQSMLLLNFGDRQQALLFLGLKPWNNLPSCWWRKIHSWGHNRICSPTLFIHVLWASWWPGPRLFVLHHAAGPCHQKEINLCAIGALRLRNYSLVFDWGDVGQTRDKIGFEDAHAKNHVDGFYSHTLSSHPSLLVFVVQLRWFLFFLLGGLGWDEFATILPRKVQHLTLKLPRSRSQWIQSVRKLGRPYRRPVGQGHFRCGVWWWKHGNMMFCFS